MEIQSQKNCFWPRKRLRELWQKKCKVRELLINWNRTYLEWQDKPRKNNKVIVGMPSIGDKHENIKVSLEDKMEVLKEYDKKLLNEENNQSGKLNVEKNERPC